MKCLPSNKTAARSNSSTQAGQPVDTMAYLKQRENAALQGQVYNPTVGFALVGNTGAGQKYPYDPFYGGFSPRVALAWNPQL